MSKYDPQEEARLVALADAKENERQSIARKMHDVLGRDPDAKGAVEEPKVLDTDEMMRYKSLEMHEQMLGREVGELRAAIKAITDVKPMEPVEAKRKEEADPFVRWGRKRRNGLEADEIRDMDETLERFYSGTSMRNPGVDRAFAVKDILPKGPARAVITPEAAGQNQVQQDTVTQSITFGLHDYGGALQMVSTVSTPNGNTIEYPLYDDGASKRGQVPAGANLDAQLKADQTENPIEGFNLVKIEAFPRNTGFIDLSQWANEDVAWDYGVLIREILLERMGRMIESDLTNGTGADRVPTGFMTRAGEWQPTAHSTTLKWQDLNELQYQIDASYLRGSPRGLYAFGSTRMGGFVGYVTSRAFMGIISRLSDSQNRPLMMPSITMPGAMTLFGYGINVCEEITDKTYANNLKPILFGNFSYMTFRTSGAGLVIEEHYDSATAINNTSRFLGRMRYDSEYLGPYSAYTNGVPANAATAVAYKAFKAKTTA